MTCSTSIFNISLLVPSNLPVNLVLFNEDYNYDCDLALRRWLVRHLEILFSAVLSSPLVNTFLLMVSDNIVFGAFMLRQRCWTCTKCPSGNMLRHRLTRQRRFISYKLDILSKYESKIAENNRRNHSDICLYCTTNTVHTNI